MKLVNTESRAEAKVEDWNSGSALQGALRNSVSNPSEVVEPSIEDDVLVSLVCTFAINHQ